MSLALPRKRRTSPSSTPGACEWAAWLAAQDFTNIAEDSYIG